MAKNEEQERAVLQTSPGANQTTIKDPLEDLVFAADVNISKAISTKLKVLISCLFLTFPPARFDLEILFSAGKELMALTVLNLSEIPGEAPPTAVTTVSYLPGMSWPGPLRPGTKSPQTVRSPAQ